ncbi:MAG: hypothetical protein KY428_01625 [Bacteroidetes bacterium]|nr:hypothetical protein [Bacteroidota bacterium]
MNIKDINDFKIIYGSTQEEIEAQVKALEKQGYLLHGTMVAQANPDFYASPTGDSPPFLYYQMLARKKADHAQEKNADAQA